MNTRDITTGIQRLQLAFGFTSPIPVVIELPNGERYEATTLGFAQGSSFMNAKGRLDTSSAYILKPIIYPKNEKASQTPSR